MEVLIESSSADDGRSGLEERKNRRGGATYKDGLDRRGAWKGMIHILWEKEKN